MCHIKVLDQTNMHTNTATGIAQNLDVRLKFTERQTRCWMDGQMNQQTDRQMNRQMNKPETICLLSFELRGIEIIFDQDMVSFSSDIKPFAL